MAARQSDGIRMRTSTGIIKLTLWSAMLVFSIGFSVAVGCSGDAGTESNSDTEAQLQNGAQNLSLNDAQNATTGNGPADQLLVGEWHGAAWLDESILAEKLAKLSEGEREQVLNQAKFFGATIMAFVFDKNGDMESVVDVLPDGGIPGPPLVGNGTWKVLREQSEGVVVETLEQADDGALTPSQRVYKFYENGDSFAMHVPLTGILGECNPVIIFERVIYTAGENGPGGAAENVADAQTGTLQK